jgi:hypothetical protein
MLNDDEAPTSGERILIGKPDTDFLSVVFWHVSHITHCYRVIHRQPIWLQQRRPVAEKIFSFETQSPTSS